MQQIHNVEEIDSQTPLICIYGKYSEFTQRLIDQWLPQFKIIYIDTIHPEKNNENKNFYFIKSEEISLITKLQEKIDYAVAFLQSADDKVHIDALSKKLIQDNTKSLIIVPVIELQDYADIILTFKKERNIFFATIGEFIHGDNQFATIIRKIIAEQKVTLTGNDLYPTYPIASDDAALFINRLLFSKQDRTKLTQLFYRHPETMLSAVHLLNRVIPDMQVVFEEGTEEAQSRITRDMLRLIVTTKLQMEEQYLDEYGRGFENSISDLMNQKTETPKNMEPSSTKQKEKKERKKYSFHIFPLILAIGGGVGIFLLMQLLFLGLGLFFLKNSIASFEKKDYKSVISQSHVASFFLNTTNDTVLLGAILFKPFDSEGKLSDTYTVINHSLSLVTLASNTVTDILNQKQNLTRTKIDSIITHSTFLYTEGQRIKKEQNNNALNNLLTDDQSKMISIAPYLPNLLGYDSEKHYLILFQNSGELRPTGGFIGSVGELTIKNAQVKDFTIQDVYDFDGQLKVHIEPPFIVRRYLQPHLYLRDSNFYPDFQESASKAALLYNLETEKKPDGIMAVDFEVLKKILEVAGPLTVTGYEKKVTSDNIFDIIEDSIDKNKFPGSTVKKNLLHDIYTSLLLRLEERPELWVKIGLLTPKIFNEKHALIALRELPYQDIFNANNYGGEMKDKRIKENDKMYDYLSVNEANIGVNKANSKVSRRVEYEAQLSDTSVESKATISFTNTFKERYKTYLRIMVPQGSKLEKITINGVEQKRIPAVTDAKLYEAKTFKSDPSQLEVEETEYNNLRMFGFIAEVPEASQTIINVYYSNGIFKKLSPLNYYSLTYVKQPGTLTYPISFTMRYPQGYGPVNTDAQSFGTGFLKFDEDISTDKDYSIQIQKKAN